jgi:transcriptional regulator with XRE-family HTH domain
MSLTPADIAGIRARLGLSQADLGSLTGAHWVTVSRWERGQLAPNGFQGALLQKFQVASEFGPRAATLIAALLKGTLEPMKIVYMLLALADVVEREKTGEPPREDGFLLRIPVEDVGPADPQRRDAGPVARAQDESRVPRKRRKTPRGPRQEPGSS